MSEGFPNQQQQPQMTIIPQQQQQEQQQSQDTLMSNNPLTSSTSPNEQAELEAIRNRVREMEEEARKLKEMQATMERNLTNIPSTETDSKSIYVGNVDYGATPEELQAHFGTCGVINRITILCDKWTGHPKGFAYIEFAEIGHVANAMALDGSMFRNRILSVSEKRTNVPGLARGRGRGRARGGVRGGRSRSAHFGI